MIEGIPPWTVTELSPTEFDVCHELLALPPVPLVLAVPSPGRTSEERSSVIADALDSLTRRGLADGDGPHPDLADALGLTHRFDWAADLRFWTGTHQLRARIAIAGDHAVIVGIDRGRVVLYPLPAHAALEELLSTTGDPRIRGPRHRTINIRTTALTAATTRAGSRGVRLSDELIAEGEPRAAASAVGHLTSAVISWGQIAVATGAQGRSSRVVAFHDTPTCRVMHLRRPEHTTFAPVTNTQLAAAVHELLEETRSGR